MLMIGSCLDMISHARSCVYVCVDLRFWTSANAKIRSLVFAIVYVVGS
jgi:hypothetical protein